MKAAVVTDFHSPLQIHEVPVPGPGPGDVRVGVATSGSCHPDVRAAHGDRPVPTAVATDRP